MGVRGTFYYPWLDACERARKRVRMIGLLFRPVPITVSGSALASVPGRSE